MKISRIFPGLVRIDALGGATGFWQSHLSAAGPIRRDALPALVRMLLRRNAVCDALRSLHPPRPSKARETRQSRLAGPWIAETLGRRAAKAACPGRA